MPRPISHDLLLLTVLSARAVFSSVWLTEVSGKAAAFSLNRSPSLSSKIRAVDLVLSFKKKGATAKITSTSKSYCKIQTKKNLSQSNYERHLVSWSFTEKYKVNRTMLFLLFPVIPRTDQGGLGASLCSATELLFLDPSPWYSKHDRQWPSEQHPYPNRSNLCWVHLRWD